MFTQVAGITLATPTTWRFVFFISFIISVLQFLFSSMIVESPTWLFNQSRLDEHKHAVSRLWGNVVCKMTEPLYMTASTVTHLFSYQVEEPLLNQFEDTREVSPQKSLTIPQVFAVIGLRKPLMIVSLVMVSQQVSGK
jgi:Sugar (and other) transporter